MALRSSELFRQAQRVLPGGVNSPVRAFQAVGGEPLFIARGAGAYLWDVDGRRLLDLVGSWGPLILGHAHPRVVEAVVAAASRGTSFGAPTELEVRLAELVREAFPTMELMRFVNSGTEATMSALRLARAYTGRDAITKFEGCYHGHSDGLLVKAGSGALTLGVPSSPGVPVSYAQHTLVARYNDLGSVERLLEEHRGRVAAIIVEPVAGNMGVVLPREGFLAGLRRLADAHGALLVFDEVITGFRLAFGGAQALFGVVPDLTCLGKIIGGGLPVGAYGGRQDIMARVAPLGPVYQAGTLSGNPLAMAAGLATLTVLREQPPYAELERLSARLAEGLQTCATRRGVPATVNRAGSMLTLFFTSQPVEDAASAGSADTEQFARFFQAMLRRGVYLPPAQFEAMFLSAAHGDQEVTAILATADEALAELASTPQHPAE